MGGPARRVAASQDWERGIRSVGSEVCSSGEWFFLSVKYSYREESKILKRNMRGLHEVHGKVEFKVQFGAKLAELHACRPRMHIFPEPLEGPSY